MRNDSRQSAEREQQKQLAVPDSVEVIKLNLHRPRLIVVRGVGLGGREQEYCLRVTRKHNLTLG